MRQTGEEHEKYTRRHGLAPEGALITAPGTRRNTRTTCQVNHLRLSSTTFPDGWPSCCRDFLLSHFMRDEFCLPAFPAPRSPALSTTNLSCSQKRLEDPSLHISNTLKSPYRTPIPHSIPSGHWLLHLPWGRQAAGGLNPFPSPSGMPSCN